MELSYDVGDGPEKTLVYVQPDVTSFYNKDDPPASTLVEPKFRGLAGKFINMSNKFVTLYWEETEGGLKHAMKHHKPFTTSGTGTFPGHRFVFSEDSDPDKILARFVVEEYPENIYVYDPYLVEGDPVATENKLKKELTKEERVKYNLWHRNLIFNEQYRNATGRSYLANFPRGRPRHFMWRADYFGQEHWVTSRETQFVELPPEDDLEPILVYGKERALLEDDPRLLEVYRQPNQKLLNMTMKVLSCAPRVFEIPNFLSAVEVAHIIDIAQDVDLKLSSTGDVNKGEKAVEEETRRTRTSYNSWVPREKSPILDAIYRRGADLMRIDEALFRYRGDGEYPELESPKSISEMLQLVHYGVKQEYTAHHDFGYSLIDDEIQGSRYATLLLYLNEGMEGGETSFPRWQNAETFKKLKVTPEIGKAVLFFNRLPGMSSRPCRCNERKRP
jgi:prolyl 4-hydroxylase